MTLLGILLLVASVAGAQEQTTTLRVGARLVVVPTTVRTKAGDPVFTLEAKDFLVTDDGVEQKVRLEDDGDGQALALVVVVEAGDAPGSKFDDYAGLGRMIDGLLGAKGSQVAVVGFDSEPAVVQPWTDSADVAQAAFAKIETGDGGAASLDALVMADGLLRKQPVSMRRAILLVSETVDRGSHAKLAQALRAVADSNTAIYSLGYSSTRAANKHEASQIFSSEPGPPHGCMGKNADVDLEGNPLDPPASPKAQGSSAGKGAGATAIKAYDCLSVLAPPLRLAKMAVLTAINGFKANVPEEAAKITGGEYFKAENGKTLERDIFKIGNRLPNRYFLSFTPTASHPGLHAIAVSLREERGGVLVEARRGYWEE